MDIGKIQSELASDLDSAISADGVQKLRTRYLGRKGRLNELRKTLDWSALSDEQRRRAGMEFNGIKARIEKEIADRFAAIKTIGDGGEAIDVTLPVKRNSAGSLHPITLIQLELEDILRGMGFMVLQGFEVETEYYNFDALNTPRNHPARDMQDTFWLENGSVLRTHTSANQVRTLEAYPPPVRAVFPGRCFRNEATDASHENTFYQMEGLFVDHEVSISHLIAVMTSLLNRIFHKTAKIRLRPGFFPFVEPGFELDIECLICGGRGCPTCKQSGWVELMPCGLVHPSVIKFGGLDPLQWRGFAFGLGMTRLAMMKYGIADIRAFNSGDIRFAEQFPAFI